MKQSLMLTLGAASLVSSLSLPVGAEPCKAPDPAPLRSAWCLAALSAVQACAAAASGPDVPKFLNQRGWTGFDSAARLTSPVEGVVPVMYYAKGAKVPSCGLLSGAAAPTFVEIQAAEPGEQYPQCTGINDAAAFKLAGKDYLVFEYTNRDSRNESYEQFFYVFKNKGGEYVADEKLN